MRRGRPRNDAAKDAKIAEAVYRLCMWGFALPEVFEAVAGAALSELGRGDHAARALGADRVKQIYGEWMKSQELRAVRWRYAKQALELRRPPGSLRALAKKVVRGWWPRYDGPGPGDPELSPKGHEDYLKHRLRWSGQKQGRKIDR